MGKSSETETNTVAEPWSGVQPFLRDIVGGAQGGYGAGLFDFPVWPGARVAPQSTMTGTAQDMFWNTATGGNPFLSAVTGAYPSMTGFAPQSWMTERGLSGIADAASGGDPFMTGAMGLFGGVGDDGWQRFAQPSDAKTWGRSSLDDVPGLREMATGRDTYRDFDTLKSNVLADVVPAVSSRFANSGMLDSSLAADTISRSATEAVAPIEYGAWENAQNRRLAAQQTIAPLEYGRVENARNRALQQAEGAAGRGLQGFNAQRGRELQALGLAPGLSAGRFTDPSMMLAAGGQADQYGLDERSRVLEALGLGPGLAAMRYLDPTMLSGAGAGYDQFNQRLLDAGMSQWYETAGGPYDSLQRAMGLGMGLGGMGGSQTSTQDGGGSGLMSTIGDVTQAVAGPLMLYKLATGASLFSDRRLKTDVARIGATVEGYPKYRFRYLWDAPGTERIGVMADELPEHLTADVAGYKAVDYARIVL